MGANGWAPSQSQARPASQPVQKQGPVKKAFIEINNGDPAAVENHRKELKIQVESDLCQGVMPIRTFEEISVLPQYMRRALVESGRQTPMPIQAQTLPIILAGQDLIGIAKTGSGKTLGFLIP